jgi:hypothetical protein
VCPKKVLDKSSSSVILGTIMVTQQAPRKAPAVTIRFRSKAELAKIKRAAKLDGLSLNTLVATAASLEANQRIAVFEERQKATKEGVSA